jgi:UDPglucose 6-dehydrogenase
MSFNIAVIGTGYVGLVSGTTFAATGNNVLCIDIDENKIAKLQQGKSPIFEPGLDYYLNQNIKEDRLHFSNNLEEAVLNNSIIFLCLPTPPSEDGSADLQHVLKVVNDICNIIKDKDLSNQFILVNKSTVPVGTVQKIKDIVAQIIPDKQVEVASNPEFLREGFAIEDALKPERIVIGTDSKFVEETMKELYQPFVRSGNPIHLMDIKSAEITKYAANAFLATKISFMNDLSAYCEKVGADIENVRIGIGSDTRIGKRFLFAGIGYGGSCFPKDVKALIYSTQDAGTPLEIVEAAQSVNDKQIVRFFEKIKKHYNGDLKGKNFSLWGLAFKPNTDDTREAPAFRLIELLIEQGATVKAYDPEAMENTKIKFGDKIEYASNPYSCLENTDSLIIATEWTLFRTPDFKKIKALLKEPTIFDGRNLFTEEEIKKFGFKYYCIGRKDIIE